MKKKQINKNTNEKPISIPLDFEDAVKKILSVKPENKTKHDKQENGDNNETA